MFQREWMKGQQIHPSEWKLKQAECRDRWHAMNAEERYPHIAAANAEQGARDLLSQIPHPSKHDEAKSDSLEDLPDVTRAGHKLISKQRLFLSYARFKADSDTWSQHGANADGLMPLDDINLNATDDQLLEMFSAFAKPAASGSVPKPSENGPAVHHTACQRDECKTSSYFGLAEKFVESMASFLSSGTLGWNLHTRPITYYYYYIIIILYYIIL